MKKLFIILAAILILGIIAFSLSVFIFPSGSEWIIPGDSVKYQTKEELTDLYWQNKVALNSVKDSVLSNKKLLQALDDYNEGDIGMSFLSDKKYFSEEEWQNVFSVFDNLHPSKLMMERKGRPLKLYFAFPEIKLDTSSMRTSLYWFPSENEIEIHKTWSLADSAEYTQIDGNWYIVEEIYPW